MKAKRRNEMEKKDRRLARTEEKRQAERKELEDGDLCYLFLALRGGVGAVTAFCRCSFAARVIVQAKRHRPGPERLFGEVVLGECHTLGNACRVR